MDKAVKDFVTEPMPYKVSGVVLKPYSKSRKVGFRHLLEDEAFQSVIIHFNALLLLLSEYAGAC